MYFSETTTGDGLIQECERICNLGATGISANSQRLKDFTVRINHGIDRFYTIAHQYDQQWNFDDRRYADNNAELPIATTSLVSGTRDYLFDDELLAATQVFVKDSSGVFHEVLPQDDISEPRVYDLQNSSGGVPETFELVGNSLILDPAPNYNSSGGLKVTFKRNGVKFATTDGAVTPGIPSLFHSYLARFASYPFLLEKGAKHADRVRKQIGCAERGDPYYGGDELAIANFISNRARPKRVRLQVRQENNR